PGAPARDGPPDSAFSRGVPEVGPARHAAQRTEPTPVWRHHRMKVVVLGATKGIGRAVARALAERGDAIFLLGRDAADLERSARDLEQRGGGARSVGYALCDLEEPSGFEAALDAAAAGLSGFDTVIVT